MNRDDTICGVATAVGAAGIGVVRVSGSRALEILTRVAPGWRAKGAPRRLRLRWLVHPETGERVDRALVAAMPGPRSYTGEDVVELQTHGGSAVTRGVLGAVRAAGAREAEPGEFTLRAFLNGRIDLAQAEAVAALVEAATEGSRRAALRQLSGGLGDALAPIRERCVGALAEVEARLDFPEEELEPLEYGVLLRELDWMRGRVSALVREGELGVRLREGIRVVILGRPNVGKSSLLNRLLGRERAIVDDEPGTTRDYLEGEVILEGLRVCLVDTAGQRFEARGPERRGVERGLEQAEGADQVLVVVNLAEGIGREDLRIFEGLGGSRWAVVLNQVDRVGPATVARCKAEVGKRAEVLAVTSARTGEGIEDLRLGLAGHLGQREGAGTWPVVSERRQMVLLEECVVGLGRAREGLVGGAPEEVVAAELRVVLRALGALLGVGVGDEVLEAIFSRFCIGK